MKTSSCEKSECFLTILGTLKFMELFVAAVFLKNLHSLKFPHVSNFFQMFEFGVLVLNILQVDLKMPE